MAFGIAELVILGLIFDWLARKIKLPGLIGLLILGVVAGSCGLNLINNDTSRVGGDLKNIALVVILLRAGFEISREVLTRVGFRALLLSFIPCLCEVGVITLAAPFFLNLTYMESAILGGVIAAVSPAVVVPLMIKFIQEGRGDKKGIPTLILAGASCDDAVAIVITTSILGMYVGTSVNIGMEIVSIPVSIITGIITGLVLGLALYYFFKRTDPRATKRVLIILGLSIMLLHFGKRLDEYFPFSALLAIMAVGFIILEKCEHTAHEISAKLGKIWIFAQILLFTIVGSQVDITVAMNAGLAGLCVIGFGLLGRTVGVQLSLIKSELNIKERLFVSISYLPKATVQAAIGSMPLMMMQNNGMNTQPGKIILALAVLAIVVTAPAGAFLISWSGPRLLRASAAKEGKSPAMKAAQESQPQD